MRHKIDTQGWPELTPQTYINRELSWIEFNGRVLAQAEDESLPLLERIKFLAIFSNNLDEFYMVRVAYVHSKLRAGGDRTRPDGLLPLPLLREIHDLVDKQVRRHRTLLREVLAQLRDQGVSVDSTATLDPALRSALRAYFNEEVFPVLTPLAVDRARPFPFISNLSLNLAVWLRRSGRGGKGIGAEFLRLKVPDTLSRLVDVTAVEQRYGSGREDGVQRFTWLEEVIADNLDMLFPGMEITEHSPFRITRDADIDFEFEQETTQRDMSVVIEEGLRERRFGPVVRLTVPNAMSKPTLDQLIEQLEIDGDRDVFRLDGPLGCSSLFQLTGVSRPDLKYPPFTPRVLPSLSRHTSIFDAIREGDILLHHPYDSFAPVEQFFLEAAHDPQVLAIKTTLYRVGRNSPIVQSLIEARDNDKQVTVLVELKARFDEDTNLVWARAMDDKGVHVTYGVEELNIKTHAKIALVVRREADGVRRYVHLGTGNYNAMTARIYTDLGLLTCNREIGDDTTRLFNRLTGFAPDTTYHHLLVAPEYVLPALVELIDNEIEAARAGKEAHLIFKMNQLEEDTMIRKLYAASQAGVQIDLIVRGLCCLVPGVPGISDNIRVRSIVGRFLEHSRIYYFHNAPPNRRVYMGSADLMRRNLYNRVEVVFPVLNEEHQQFAYRILQTCLADNVRAWNMQPDGTYRRQSPDAGETPVDSQEVFLHDSSGLKAEAR